MRFIVFQAASLSDMFLRRALSAPPHGFPYIALLDALRPTTLPLRFTEVRISSAACPRRRSIIRRGVGLSSYELSIHWTFRADSFLTVTALFCAAQSLLGVLPA